LRRSAIAADNADHRERQEMSELRVPTAVLPVEIECADGRRFSGRIFIPPASPSHDGPARAEEWINDSAQFFPFVPDGEEAPVLMNKREILVLTVLAPPLDRGSAVESPTARVRVEAESRRLEGEFVLDMPPHQRRVLDYVNRPGLFVLVWEGELRHLVQKERITRVIELR
jgi:hypothetical protein